MHYSEWSLSTCHVGEPGSSCKTLAGGVTAGWMWLPTEPFALLGCTHGRAGAELLGLIKGSFRGSEKSRRVGGRQEKKLAEGKLQKKPWDPQGQRCLAQIWMRFFCMLWEIIPHLILYPTFWKINTTCQWCFADSLMWPNDEPTSRCAQGELKPS